MLTKSERMTRMTDVNDEYYFIDKVPMRDDIPSLSASGDTVNRDYNYARQPPFSPPLTFVNGASAYNAKRGIQSVRVPPEILFNGSNMLVKQDVRDALLNLEIPNLCMHPSVYIHDDGTWYEDYWYLAFTERFDCWDRATSDYDKDSGPIRLGGFVLESVFSYSLDADLLSKTPLRERLFFQMGGVTDAPFVCHKSLFPLFHGTNGKGAELTLITDF